MLSDALLSRLTLPQREAVLHQDGPLLVVAGPGSGKTRVVTHRVAQLLSEGVPPGEILVLTFTNKAADEMKERVQQLVGLSSVWIGTFHRFCARLLRQYADRVGLDANYSIYSSNDSIAAVRSAMNRLKEMDAEEEGRFSEVKYSAESIMHAVSALKNRFLDPVKEYRPNPDEERSIFVHRLLPILAHEMQLANAVDFDDLLLLTVRLLRENPNLRQALGNQFRYVLIDEYQDTNLAQYAISHALTLESKNLMVTGDPDQSIYGWRGADISNILEFEKDFPSAKVVNLEENFRSTQLILNAAGSLISHNSQRKEKALFSNLGEGMPVRFRMDADETEEADRIAREIADAVRNGVREPGEFAIFYRMNALSVHFEKALRLHGVPFQIIHGTEFFDRAETRDLLAYFRLLANPHDNEAFLRIVNVPTRGIGKTSLDHLKRFAWANGLSLWEAAVRVSECRELKPRAASAVTAFTELILSLHSSAVQAFEHAQQNSGVRRNPEEEGALTFLVRSLLELTRYEEQFDVNDEQDAQRLRNVREFISLAARFDQTAPVPTLEAFLEQNALVSDTDALAENVWESDSSEPQISNAAALMTLHAAKGLEFPCVYLTGCEHGILPHERAFTDENQLEEERRLMFVGMTRAKEELNLSMAESRDAMGRRRTSAPSPFLMELPREQMEMENFQMTLFFGGFPGMSLDLDRRRFGRLDETNRLDESFGEGPQEPVFEDASAGSEPFSDLPFPLSEEAEIAGNAGTFTSRETFSNFPETLAGPVSEKSGTSSAPLFYDESEAFTEDDFSTEPDDFGWHLTNSQSFSKTAPQNSSSESLRRFQKGFSEEKTTSQNSVSFPNSLNPPSSLNSLNSQELENPSGKSAKRVVQGVSRSVSQSVSLSDSQKKLNSETGKSPALSGKRTISQSKGGKTPKDLRSIPGLMTGAELLRQKEEKDSF